MIIRNGTLNEAQTLWELACRSKASWGYDDEFMEACARELYPSDLTMSGVAVVTDVIVGFYALSPESSSEVELSHLFVEPMQFRKGVGRALFEQAIERATAAGFSRVTIDGDPYASEFYLRCGARKVGVVESGSIPGRLLPQYEVPLT